MRYLKMRTIYLNFMDSTATTRSWNQLRAPAIFRKNSPPLNPLRNWVENVRHQNDKKYKELNIENGLNRPEKIIQFLEGDPTKYNAFKTPLDFKQMAAKAVGQHDGYTEFVGDLSTRKKFAAKLSTENWQLTEDDVVFTAGGSGALFYCVMALCNPGDKILMPHPTFPLMAGLAKMFSVDIVWYELEDREWQPNFEHIEEQLKCHKDIRFILVNSPSNPNGSTLTETSKRRLIQICKTFNNLPIVADEIYEYMTFNGVDFKFLAEYSDTVPILSCSGLTKRALVPGWRIGWLVFYGLPGVFDEVKKAIRNFANIILMPNTICQLAAFEVYEEGQAKLRGIMEQVQRRYDCLHKNLEGVKGIRVNRQTGSLYSNIVLDLEQLEGITDARSFASQLQIEQNLLIFPGPLFFGGDFLRIVICADVEVIEEACQRLKIFLEKHAKK